MKRRYDIPTPLSYTRALLSLKIYTRAYSPPTSTEGKTYVYRLDGDMYVWKRLRNPACHGHREDSELKVARPVGGPEPQQGACGLHTYLPKKG